MGESATSLRPLSGAEEFDRRMKSLAQSPAPHSDALAELARLVGQQDPFRDGQAAAAEAPVKPEAPLASEADFSAFDHAEPPAAVEAATAPATAPRLPGVDEGWERPGTAWQYPTLVPRKDEPAEPSPDAWAEKAGEGAGEPPAEAATAPAPAEGGNAKRTLAVLAAVVALTGGGLAASFLTKTNPSASVAASSATPTIMASAGPNKVQPETPATGPDAPTEPSTLLDKNNNDGTGAAKVVNTIEQPVDLKEAVKPAPVSADAATAPAEPAAAPAAASGFPEPRKVKTVLVRPDGSIIAAATTAAPAAGAESQSLLDPATTIPIVRRDPPPAAPPPAAPAPVPTVPVPAAPASAVPAHAAGEAAMPPTTAPAAKSTNRATTPKPAASTPGSGTAAAQARTPASTPKDKPVAHAPAAAKPAAVADATPTDTVPTASTGGSFAVQLGAAPTEAEGHEAARRLAAKYGLSGTPSVIKAQAGGKTVYRIRLGRLSGDDAKALCAKVQAGGGGCFIAR